MKPSVVSVARPQDPPGTPLWSACEQGTFPPLPTRVPIPPQILGWSTIVCSSIRHSNHFVSWGESPVLIVYSYGPSVCRKANFFFGLPHFHFVLWIIKAFRRVSPPLWIRRGEGGGVYTASPAPSVRPFPRRGGRADSPTKKAERPVWNKFFWKDIPMSPIQGRAGPADWGGVLPPPPRMGGGGPPQRSGVPPRPKLAGFEEKKLTVHQQKQNVSEPLPNGSGSRPPPHGHPPPPPPAPTLHSAPKAPEALTPAA